jgi:kynurenine formamidase
VVLRARSGGREIGAAAFESVEVGGRAVLVDTGWSRHWNTEQYYEGHTFLTERAATYLQEQGAGLVGVDSYNIDDTADRRRPVHTILLGAGIPIVEHLCGLDRLPDAGFRFYAVPPRVRAFGTFPVRAFAEIPD